MGEYFPFIHFISVVIIPFVYWVACIELGVYNSNENHFTLTFGQVSRLAQVYQGSDRLIAPTLGPCAFRSHSSSRPSIQARPPFILLVL